MTWSGIPAGRIIVHVTIARVDPIDDGIPSARLAERTLASLVGGNARQPVEPRVLDQR